MTRPMKVWWCEKHGAVGQAEDMCDIAQMVELKQGWPRRCVMREMQLVPADARVIEKENSE